jgi:murein DD-endopeptidase MepM/ murein hydrolase activator NlpD
MGKTRDLQGFTILVLALMALGYFILRNNAPIVSPALPLTTPTPTQGESAWQDIVQQQLVDVPTLAPTNIRLLDAAQPPTLPSDSGTAILVQPTNLAIQPTATRYSPAKPTQPGPTAVASPTPAFKVVNNPRPDEGQFSPPPEIVPISLNPHDHFYFQRPVDSSANSTSIFWYVYGSDGPKDSGWRIHHGIDLPNPIGKAVRAAGPGRVVWAADHYLWREDGVPVDKAYTYGNVVIIEHDFGYDGQTLYTLYAHLSVIAVKQGDRVNTNDIVGLSGNTGVVSGPHVHFEVRVGRNNYFNTRNPILWMAPYLDHGVIAGKILQANGAYLQDAAVALVQKGGRTVDTTTTYVRPHTPGAQPGTFNVNPDDYWNENFVFGDVVTGNYQVVIEYNGVKITKDVTVSPATTTFIDMGSLPINAAP